MGEVILWFVFLFIPFHMFQEGSQVACRVHEITNQPVLKEGLKNQTAKMRQSKQISQNSDPSGGRPAL